MLEKFTSVLESVVAQKAGMRKFIWFVFALALLVRVGYVLQQGTKLDTAPGEMERGAINLVEHGSLANVFGDNSGPSAHVGPIYPGFLSLIYRVFGSNTAASRLAQRLASALVSSILVALVVVAGQRAGLHKLTGLTAGLLMAVLPLNLWIETAGAWEQPYSALVLMLIFLQFISLHENGWRKRSNMVMLGLLIGAEALLSTAVIPSVGLMLLFEWLLLKPARKQVFTGGCIVVFVAGLTVFPWMCRNYVVFGKFVAIRSNFGLELSLGNNPGANGTPYQHPRPHPWDNPEELKRVVELGEVEYNHQKLHQTLDWIQNHPGRFAYLTLKRCQMYWLPLKDMWPSRALAAKPASVLLKSATHCVISLACLAGLIWMWRKHHPYRGLFLAVLAGCSLLYLIAIVELRHRYPTFAFMILLGIELFFQTADWLRRQNPTQQ